jgi:tRNA-splicing ligase RtcB
MLQINDRLMSWASILEEETLRQAEKASRLPFVHPHIALMPDAHLGKGATVGSVIPTVGAIIPAAVGVDIGCGMAAVRTQYHRDDLVGDLRRLRTSIEEAVPLSAGSYNSRLTESARRRVDQLTGEAEKARFDPLRYAKNWTLQLGTLGSGNHFIEVCHDESGAVWLFLHSGSRGIGNRIATHHIQVARQLMEQRRIDLPDRDLAYLEEGSEEFDAYLRELRWAQNFALINRDEMMDRVITCFAEFVGGPVEQRDRVQCHHNYTERETHYGEQVWLSRKGAINAARGVPGLIPGSMGDALVRRRR